MLPLAALPLLVAAKAKAEASAKARDKSTVKDVRRAFEWAALLCVARAAERGERIDDAALTHVRFGVGDPASWEYRREWHVLMPIVRKAIHRLPRHQAEKVLVEALDPLHPTVFARAFRCIGSHPTPAVLEKAMHGLLDAEPNLRDDDLRDIEAGLCGLPDARACIKWLLQNGGGTALAGVFSRAAGGAAAYADLQEELRTEGVAVAGHLDRIERLAWLSGRIASRAVGRKLIPIYALRVLEEPPSRPSLNRIGGLPPGVDPSRWPTKEGEPLAHIFTLDLDTVPELKDACGGKRTLSFFCRSPDLPEPGTLGDGETAVIFSDEGQASVCPGPLPEEVELRAEGMFEAVRIEVPSAVFQSKKGILAELQSAIHLLGARVLGAPTWVQNEESKRTDFVMQFDESFVDMNLGDMGVMYVYRDGGFWQCH
jgi:hypothetical protein